MGEFRWTPEQVSAITAEDNTLLVANAGTGKTTTVIGKILWLLGPDVGTAEESEAPIPPCADPCRLDEIAAITFTEKAAYDLKRKLREQIEASERADELRWQLNRASIGTIHAFCAELLREHALRLGIDPTFRILDEREAWAEHDEVIRSVIFEALESGDAGAEKLLENYNFSDRRFSKGVIGHVRIALRDLRWHEDRYEEWCSEGELDVDRLRQIISQWDGLDDVPVEHCRTLVRLARNAKARWEGYQELENIRDFDSLILDARRLLEGSAGAAALESIRRRYRILIIDEFQDTDFAQRDIAFAIGQDAPRPQLFLVGDPKQSIYRFRGADISVWNEVRTALEDGGAPLELSRNFRSASPIVDFVNEVGEATFEQVGADLEPEVPESRVDYSWLVAGRDGVPEPGVEWLVAQGDNRDEVSEHEAGHVVARIHELVGDAIVVDPETEEERPCRYRDIALLYRSRTRLKHFEGALGRHGIPYYIAGAPHLGDRQEILDLLNVMRLIRNPHDDLRAFAYLRSPFVCLRDEVIARIRLWGKGGSLLRQAERFPEEGEWFEAPEDARVVEIEREALERGVAAIRDARELAFRIPLDELLEELLDRTGYRLHLLLMDHHEEALANIESFLRVAESYRDLSVGRFLQVWDQWEDQDTGVPQAPLYSRDDDVVTLSTIHRAKGLEWPVVFLVGVGQGLQHRRTNEFFSDRQLGPLLCPKQADQGPRAQRIVRRDMLEDRSEEARLLYVATTRARDRLIATGLKDVENSYGAWLRAGVGEVFDSSDGGAGDSSGGEAPVATVAFRHQVGEVPPRSRQPRPELRWLDDIEEGPADPLVLPIEEPVPRWISSATEMMIRAKDEDEWKLRYRHGVLPAWEFAPKSVERGALSARARGTVIHGVLERIEETDELAAILDETIAGLEDPEIEALMAAGTRYREALESEIERVVQSEEWEWYTKGEHHRELPFVHLAGPRDWRIGAFDLYRPGPGQAPVGSSTADLYRPGPRQEPLGIGAFDLDRPGPRQLQLEIAAGQPPLRQMKQGEERDRKIEGTADHTDGAEHAWVIDFKTHEIAADQAKKVAKDYAVQVQVYREAASVAGEVTVRLHFTHPNVVVDDIGKGASPGNSGT